MRRRAAAAAVNVAMSRRYDGIVTITALLSCLLCFVLCTRGEVGMYISPDGPLVELLTGFSFTAL